LAANLFISAQYLEDMKAETLGVIFVDYTTMYSFFLSSFPASTAR